MLGCVARENEPLSEREQGQHQESRTVPGTKQCLEHLLLDEFVYRSLYHLLPTRLDPDRGQEDGACEGVSAAPLSFV